MKRISMAGSDIAVTDDRIAAVLLEYAKHLGSAGTTDTVTLPVAANGRVQEASLLLGPASEIAVTDNNDISLEGIELPGVDAVVDDLQHRIQRLLGHGNVRGPAAEDGPDATHHGPGEPLRGEDGQGPARDPGDPRAAFVDFDEFDPSDG